VPSPTSPRAPCSPVLILRAINWYVPVGFTYIAFNTLLLSMSRLLVIALLTFLVTPSHLFAKPEDSSSLKLGMVTSLTSFAANYGTAVLEGAQVAVEELATQNVHIELAVEDDQSSAKNAVSAYSNLNLRRPSKGNTTKLLILTRT
jgi:ABC-type branched-subunit amino acid transport system substrate-binding protein